MKKGAEKQTLYQGERIIEQRNFTPMQHDEVDQKNNCRISGNQQNASFRP